VIPGRRFRDKPVAKDLLAFLLAAIAARVLKYNVHRSLPQSRCGRRGSAVMFAGQHSPWRAGVLRRGAGDLSFRMIFWPRADGCGSAAFRGGRLRLQKIDAKISILLFC
jgi:hypothetical protein